MNVMLNTMRLWEHLTSYYGTVHMFRVTELNTHGAVVQFSFLVTSVSGAGDDHSPRCIQIG